MLNFAWGIFLLGAENLKSSEFDRLENFYLVGARGNEPLVMGEGEVGGMGGSLLGGIFPGGGDEQIFG